MRIAVTGATGHLGHLIVESLLDRGILPVEITAAGRTVARAADLAAKGVNVVPIAYEDPASLAAAFAGVDGVVLVSGSEVGKRLAQHRNVIAAAKAAGVERIVYTSIPHAGQTPMLLAAEHSATEAEILEAGLPYTFLRNGWYVENYTRAIPQYLEHGIVGAAGEGRVSLAPRADFAEAAAVVASQAGHAGRIYELGGQAVTLAEFAALVSEATGREVRYTDVPVAELTAILMQAGLPEQVATVFADVDGRIKAGDLEVTSGDLERLIGRPPTPVAQSVREAVAAL